MKPSKAMTSKGQTSLICGLTIEALHGQPTKSVPSATHWKHRGPQTSQPSTPVKDEASFKAPCSTPMKQAPTSSIPFGTASLMTPTPTGYGCQRATPKEGWPQVRMKLSSMPTLSRRLIYPSGTPSPSVQAAHHWSSALLALAIIRFTCSWPPRDRSFHQKQDNTSSAMSPTAAWPA